ncbi:bifunctional folylpolyglutamate synthase/dihydrofolate synthase [Rhizorhapis sp. SPR117]|uniref:bifunctional folylpolyglutamate synthase/dihydrofolate synthase n=1 Tax=Rhizorhapis sp. SPR117 TaxID=2912611 RepID=UPI001F3BCCFC|nr:bifunctional folylpolyglutamate synthase/dihydrofolate synthase [Rhizorhapis sp. SPR117]
MPDQAHSSDPSVQAQLDRLAQLSPGRDILGLERITALLTRLGNPQHSLPPVFHVAGTNGKGSTCAFLRAALEADGKSIHAYTSPHLVRFNERIRVNGKLIADAELAHYLTIALDHSDGIGASFFEVTTAAAFLAFAENPADACIIEVGLGGRLDATNVISAPAVCGIAQLGIDHQSFLGESLLEIAGEKAGIAKRDAPLVTMKYPDPINNIIRATAEQAGASWLPMGQDWDAAVYRERLHYRDAEGRIDIPLPRMPGAHQTTNAALALAMLRHQNVLSISEAAIKAAPLWAHWPARLQRLERGPLTNLLPNADIWLDGGHNPAAAEVLAQHFHASLPPPRKIHLVLGMLANKDLIGFLTPLQDHLGSVHAIPVPDHDHHDPGSIVKLASDWGIKGETHSDIAGALSAIADKDQPTTILIGGSLYLAGEVLRRNEQVPD